MARNILLAELTGTRVHCQHLSSAGSVALLREAKRRGVPISGEACPHHFVLTDATIAGSEKFWAGDGKDLFFHSTNVEGSGYEALREGQKVSYTEGRGPKGPRAENVKAI